MGRITSNRHPTPSRSKADIPSSSQLDADESSDACPFTLKHFGRFNLTILTRALRDGVRCVVTLHRYGTGVEVQQEAREKNVDSIAEYAEKMAPIIYISGSSTRLKFYSTLLHDDSTSNAQNTDCKAKAEELPPRSVEGRVISRKLYLLARAAALNRISAAGFVTSAQLLDDGAQHVPGMPTPKPAPAPPTIGKARSPMDRRVHGHGLDPAVLDHAMDGWGAERSGLDLRVHWDANARFGG